MAYGIDLAGAARRHLQAAQDLYATTVPGAMPGNKAVAGYLFGLAGELALKEIMRDSGMQSPADDKKKGAFFKHFPAIKTSLRDTASGRRAKELQHYARNSALFQHWSTDMRYAPAKEINPDWVDKWKQSAEELVGAMNAL